MTSQNSEALTTLHKTIVSTEALIVKFESGIQTTSLPVLPLTRTSPNALALLSDASQVLKAQTTKLSLLVLNKPFTPSEITHILRALSNESIPALVSAAQLCPHLLYTRWLHRTIRSSVSAALKELLNLLNEIPSDEQGIEKSRGRDTLASTGVIWQCCDSMVQLGSGGFTTHAPAKLKELEDLFSDAIEELEDWKTGNDEDESEDSEVEHDSLEEKAECARNGRIPGESPLGTKDRAEVEDDAFAAPQPASSSLRPLVAKVLKTMRLIKLLFPPLAKRRVRKFPQIDARTKLDEFPTPEQTTKFDMIMGICQSFCDEADEIAGALYQDDEEEVEERLESMKGCARTCIDEMRETWDGEEDEFSLWTDKFLIKLDEL